MIRRFALAAALAAVTSASLSTVTNAAINGFGDLSGFTINQVDSAAAPTLQAGVLQLAVPSTAIARSIFYNTPQSVNQFTASFTFRASNGAADTGATFVLQNAGAGVHALGDLAVYGYGYVPFVSSGIPTSAAVVLSLGQGNANGPIPSLSGYFTNGAQGITVATGAVNLAGGNPIDVTLVYNGSLLSETLTDTVTHASYGTSYAVNIPATVGGSTALIGLTAANANTGAAQMYFSNFQFTNAIPEPGTACVTFGGVAAFARRRRR